MENEPKVNSCRIVKLDKYNFTVQRYKEYRDPKNPEVVTRKDWEDIGYFGNKLDWAVNSSLMQGVPEGESLLGEFKEAAEHVIKNISSYYGIKNPTKIDKKEIAPEPVQTEPVKKKRGRPPKLKE